MMKSTIGTLLKLTLILLVSLTAFFACEQRASLPDFTSFEDIGKKKEVFFQFLSPIVAEENQQIRSQRDRLKRIHERFEKTGKISFWDRGWLDDLARSYDVAFEGRDPEPLDWARLLRRVGPVPRDLVLVQAAIESAWGTSRFAREGNNFFGEHCTVPGCGLVPEARPQGQNWEVAVFDSPAASIRSYLFNINTHPAYQALRQMRADLHRRGEKPDGILLARALEAYSERGEAYVKDVQAMIRANQEEIPR